MIQRNDATEAQVRAAAPMESTWLSANAGSGKTRVLTDRVARLLLEGVPPQKVLCLTYTKAAATEMQNRLFGRLGEWAMLADNELRLALDELGVEAIENTVEARKNARTLFARAIETPGGLKIQTIHSFCAALLRRFPLEAGVSPQFREMDDRAAKRLREDVLEELANASDTAVLDGFVKHLSDDDPASILMEIIRHRDALINVTEVELTTAFDLPTNFQFSDLLKQVFLGSETDLLTNLLTVLKTGSKMDVKAAEKLAPLAPYTPSVSLLVELESLFLNKSGANAGLAKIGKFPTKASQAALGSDIDQIEDLMKRVESARDTRLSLLALEKTRALTSFARAFLPKFEHKKLTHGWLDFDDLILKARQLLTDPAVSSWVLFRLDGGIDHILVDEAQDTSPVQWDVVRLLAQEFTSGEGARADTQRTLFVVGDKKQSIYSFQGADPAAFDNMKHHFSDALSHIGEKIHDRKLLFSFRSSAPILRLVDTVCGNNPDAGFIQDLNHRAFHDDLPGRVDICAVVEKPEALPDQDWTDSVDRLPPQNELVVLASQIAEQIQSMIGTAITNAKGQTRAITAGDFLILVQRRSALFHEIIRACKAAQLPLAGADRLKIGGELAVKDLGALLRFLDLNEDSLSLAAVLKSPLFGWSEQDIYSLAQGREQKYLWAELRDNAEKYPETVNVLNDLRKNADFLRPFELMERVLTRHGGRRALIARLGHEAEEGIDALLNQALVYEQNETPSLAGFISWVDSGEIEVKRQIDSASDQIRVMTVHGAKGLEAPIVILPDTGSRRNDLKSNLLPIADGIVSWKTLKEDAPSVVKTAREEALTRREDEGQRLLYVAMTRAEQWLIVYAAGKVDDKSWYSQIERGMQGAGAVQGPIGLRLESGDWTKTAHDIEIKTDVAHTLPEWATISAPAKARPKPPVSPSKLGGSKALAGDGGLDEDAAMARGDVIHKMLEVLPLSPKEEWASLAEKILADAPFPDVIDEVLTVLNDPDLAHVFAANTLTEVNITATLPELSDSQILGQIDRLIIEPDKITLIDFKSNHTPAKTVNQVPDGLLRQLGAYAAALAQIYPNREIKPAILWTKNAYLQHIPHEVVRNALLSTTTS